MIQTKQKKKAAKKSIRRLFHKRSPNWITGTGWQLHATDLTVITSSSQGNILCKRKVKFICNELLLRQEESFFSDKRLNKYRACARPYKQGCRGLNFENRGLLKATRE